MKHYYENIQGWSEAGDLIGIYGKMVEKFNDGAHFVEIGTWKGRSAIYMGVEIVNSNKKIKFDCIDYWLEGTIEDNYLCFLENIKPLTHIINYYKLKSIDASKLYEDQSLDFIFIDADHTYEGVMNDLIHWYPKVKFGGVISGHDYFYGPEGEDWGGVKRAVDEFFSNKIETVSASWVHYK
jgi:predicted O-methyltransferase YrrM